jgi:hypothetical protein
VHRLIRVKIGEFDLREGGNCYNLESGHARGLFPTEVQSIYHEINDNRERMGSLRKRQGVKDEGLDHDILPIPHVYELPINRVAMEEEARLLHQTFTYSREAFKYGS